MTEIPTKTVLLTRCQHVSRCWPSYSSDLLQPSNRKVLQHSEAPARLLRGRGRVRKQACAGWLGSAIASVSRVAVATTPVRLSRERPV